MVFLTGVFPKITKVVFGDAGGVITPPNKQAIQLINPIQEGLGTTVARLANPNRLYIYTQIPISVGDITLREVGLFNENNQLIAIGGGFEKYKPPIEEALEKYAIYITLPLSSTQDVTVQFSNDNLYATQDTTDMLQDSIEERRLEIIEINNKLPTKINYTDIVNDLVTAEASKPLSAAQGKVLKELIDTINNILRSDSTALDSLQEVVDFIELNRETLLTLSIPSIAGLQVEDIDWNVDNI